jgi:hypothetical protein
VGPDRKAKGCFLRGSQETLLYRFVSLGTANPEGGEAEAEPRYVASAQGPSPARRARERGREKGVIEGNSRMAGAALGAIQAPLPEASERDTRGDLMRLPAAEAGYVRGV